MARILILGGGRIGGAIGRDLAQRHQVCVGDLDRARLNQIEGDSIETTILDVTDRDAVSETVGPFDIVVGAVPGHLGFGVLESVVRTGKPIVDISFCAENALLLDDLAKRMNTIAVVDAGVAPGIDNLILGHHDRSMKVDRFECLVGGLPKLRRWPFEYKAPFSPIDVIEEYTRPARFVEGGRVVTRPALSNPELVHFDEVGTLEAFNTDGLRTLIETMPHIPYMREKTLRYPGHVKLIKVLRDAGFLSPETVTIDGLEVSPLEFTSHLLTKQWHLGPTEAEFTIMRVTIEGTSGEKMQRFVYTLYDEYDPVTETSSMARTTGYTCAAVVELILDGHFNRIGVSPPEIVGREVGCFGRVVRYLAERGVTLKTEN